MFQIAISMVKNYYLTILSTLVLSIFSVQTIDADNVAKIGETEYQTLADAVDVVPNDGTETTITLISNAVNAAALDIAFGKNVVLDLQGFSVSRTLNAATNDGHVIKVESGATLTVQDTSEGAAGTITGGNTKGRGGGIHNLGTFILKSGAITGNKAELKAGGILNATSATLIIEGGEVSNNTVGTNTNTERFGAGIFIEGGTANISSCTIKNNEGRNQGGGIYVNAGEVTVTNTKITGNKSWANATGAGVHLKGGTLTIDGGEITGNIGTKDNYMGVGLYYEGGTLNIKGAVTITDNCHKSSSTKISNVYLPKNKTITVTGSLEGSSIGVTLETTTGVITNGLEGNGDASCFTSDNTNYIVELTDDNEAIIHKEYVCKNITTNVRYETLEAAVNAANNGNTIVPLKDINLTTGLYIPANKEIVLDLQGYTLSRSLTQATGSGYVVKVAGGATVTIQDTSEGEKGKITGGWNNSQGGGIYNDGTLTLKDIIVTGNKSTGGYGGGGIYSSGGSTITIENCEISNNEADIKGGAIHISSRQESTITNCTIKGNKTTTATDGVCGGLYIQRGTVTVTGCTITENEGNGNGGGMFIGNDSDNPVVTIASTTITYNTSTGDGAGLYYNQGTLKMEGAVTISGNGDASNLYLTNGKNITVVGPLDGSQIGVTLQTETGVFTSGLPGNGDTDCFTSDNTAYNVFLYSSGEALLGTPVTIQFVNPSDDTQTMDNFVFAGGTTVQLPECTFTAPEEDQILKYWTTNEDGTGTQYSDKGIISGITEDMTLYAQWGQSEYVCKNKDTEERFLTLADGIESCKDAATDDGRTVVLIADITVPSTVANNEFILDLNDHSITGSLAIFTTETCEITDNGTEQKGTITATDDYAVLNQSHDLIISGGTFESTGESDIYNNGGIVTINGGTFNGNWHADGEENQDAAHGLKYKVNGGKYKNYDYNIHCGIQDPDKTLSAEPIDGYYQLVNREVMCQIGSTEYRSIESAIEAAGQGNITLLRDVEDGHGIELSDGNNVVIDFDGHTYQAITRPVGPGTDTPTQVIHYDNTLTLKNGTIKVKEGQGAYFPVFLQSNGDLTLEDITVYSNNLANNEQVFNFNSGSSTIKGQTKIYLADCEERANGAMTLNFDPDGATLSIDGNGVEIYGTFKVAKPSEEATSANGLLSINGGYFEDFIIEDWSARTDKSKIEISGGTYAANSDFITSDRHIDDFCIEEYCACDHRQAKGDRPETWTVRWPVPELDASGSYAGYSRTADKAVTSAYYTRSFSEKVTNNYQCWFVPFDYQVTEEENEDGWEFYEIKTTSGTGNKTVIGIEKLNVGDLLEANKPYVIKPAKVETHGFASPYNKTLKAVDDGVVLNLEGGNNFDFYGVYQRTYATTKDEWLTVSVKGTSFWAVPGDDVKPFRWIIKVTDAETGAPAKVNFTFTENIIDETETTGISDASLNAENDNEVIGIYTIDGVKTDQMRKGLNIVKMRNNKTKVVLMR